MTTSRPQCRKEHEYTPENTYVNPSGYKTCRACMRNSQRKYSKRNPDRYEKRILNIQVDKYLIDTDFDGEL